MPLFRSKMRWLATALGLVSSPVLLWLVVDVVASHQLKKARAAFALEGFPDTQEQILPAPASDEDNAAPVFAEIDRRLRAPDPTPLPAQATTAPTAADTLFPSLPHSTRPRTLSDRLDRITELSIDHFQPAPAAEILIEQRTLFEAPALIELLALAETASKRPRFVPSIDYAAGPALQVEHIGTIRNIVRLLNARAALRLHSGADADLVWDDLLSAERLGQLAAEGPTLINQLTSVACSGINQRTMIDALSAGLLPEQATEILAYMVAYPASTDGGFARAVAGERILFLDWMTRWLAKAADESSAERERLVQEFLLPDSARMLPFAAQRTWIEIKLARSYQAHLELMRVLRDEPRDRWISELRRVAEPMKEDPLFAMIPIYSKISITVLAEQARRNAVTITFAASMRRRDTGVWPASIDELGLPRAFAIDPCSGHPLHYLPREDGLLVYADGPDAKNDSGRDWQSTPERSILDGDIVVEIKLSR